MSSIKRDVKKKSSASTGGEGIFLEIQPTVCKSASRFEREVFSLGCLPSLWGSSADGDDAHRVCRVGKRVLVSLVSTMVLSEAQGLSLFLVIRGGIAV
jgi:hypothetical protein